jgi:lysophospholipase L1-like esterase
MVANQPCQPAMMTCLPCGGQTNLMGQNMGQAVGQNIQQPFQAGSPQSSVLPFTQQMNQPQLLQPQTSAGNMDLSSMMSQLIMPLMTAMMSMMMMMIQTLLGGQSAGATEEASSEEQGETSGSTSTPNTPVTETPTGTTPPVSASSSMAPLPAPTGTGTGKPQILIEGDSLSTVAGGSYADRMNKALKDKADVIQLAKGGDSIKGILGQDIPQADLVKKAEAFKAKGWRVVVLTSAQFGGKKNSAAQDEQRRQFNDLIRNAGPWDSLVDVASLPEFSDKDDAVTSNRKYYSGDGVHLTGEGYKLIFDQVMAAIQSVVG